MKRVIISILVAVTATRAFAQPGLSPAAPVVLERPPLCVTRHNCKANLILETSLSFKPIVTDGSGNEPGFGVDLEAGLVFNALERQGFGLSGGMHYVDDAGALPFVVRGRYRQWLSERTNLDVSPGVLIANVNRGGNGGTLQLAYERTGKIALVLDVDVYRASHDGGQTVFELGIGVKFCGFWSLPPTLLTLLFAAAARGST